MARLCLLLALLCACAGPRPRPPSDLRQSAAFLTFGTEGLLFTGPDYAARAALAPVDKDGKPDVDRVIFSNFRKDERLYFLDLPPGRYAPVAAYWTEHGLRHAVKIEEKDAALDIPPGELRFLGDFTARRRWEDWPRFLLNGLLSAKILVPPFRPAVAFLDAPVRIHDKSAAAEIRALRAAVKDLSGTEWARAAQERLVAMKAPPPALTERRGIFRRKEVPVKVHWTPMFGYIDTLEWGEPADVPGGLEWRHPKDKARVQVALRDSPPLATALEKLKGLGSPEDSHTHSMVYLSTRPAYAVRYTNYHYPEPYLTGEVVKVSVTETLLVPDPRGYFVVQMRASREDFPKVLPAFVRFRTYLRLEPPPKEDK